MISFISFLKDTLSPFFFLLPLKYQNEVTVRDATRVNWKQVEKKAKGRKTERENHNQKKVTGNVAGLVSSSLVKKPSRQRHWCLPTFPFVLFLGISKVNCSSEVSSHLHFHFGLHHLGFVRAALGTGTWAEGVGMPVRVPELPFAPLTSWRLLALLSCLVWLNSTL